MASYYQSVHSLSIKAPAAKVYEALTDWTIRSQWQRGIKITWEQGSKAFVNQKVTFQLKGVRFSYDFSFRITGLEAPACFYMEYFGKILRGRAAVEITPEEQGCVVAFHWMKIEPVAVIARIVFGLGIGMRFHRIRTMQTLRMLKEFLERT